MIEAECAVEALLGDMVSYLEWLDERRSELSHELALICAEEDHDVREDLKVRRQTPLALLRAEKALAISKERSGDWRSYVSDYYEQIEAVA